eukprot:6466148-Amphidinium_carterae.1
MHYTTVALNQHAELRRLGAICSALASGCAVGVRLELLRKSRPTSCAVPQEPKNQTSATGENQLHASLACEEACIVLRENKQLVARTMLHAVPQR